MSEYQHKPDQGSGIDRQFLVYMMLAFLVVLLFRGVLFKTPPPPENQPPVAAKSKSEPQNPAATSATPASETTATAVAAKQADAETETVVENSLYRITLTNRGGQVKSWLLKKYNDDKGQPLDLVNHVAAAKMGLPLSLWTYDATLRSKLNSALYVVSAENCPAPESDKASSNQSKPAAKSNRPQQPNPSTVAAPTTLIFEYSDSDAVVRKSFSFDHSYVVKIETSVTHNGAPVPAYPAWPSSLGDQITAASYAAGRVDWRTPDGAEHQPANQKNFIRPSKWVANGDTLHGSFYWAGVSDQYFAALFMPSQPRSAAVVTLHEEVDAIKDPRKPESKENSDSVHVLGVATGNPAGTTSESLYVGPKSIDALDSVHSYSVDGVPGRGPDLENVIDFGFFGVFAKWLFLWLNWTHDHWIANWGWAIIVLTFIINIAVLPLRIKGMKTSLKMQKIQPQIQAIQKKYEKFGLRDPRKAEMQQEIWALQKKEGVSLGGGCLPMFLQLPILWAFYSVLSNTIELRQAGWAWIHDLSSADPWHILPIATIITMIALQQMTPAAGMDPAQRRMMNIVMPLTFGFWTWAVSAGLALYWTVSNFISLGQQVVMNRTHLGQEIRELQEKRARKQKK